MMSPTSVVVVDLPLVPVIAISVLATKRDASSISPVTVTPAARAAASSGISGTPGDSTISSAPVNVARRWPPSSRSTPAGQLAQRAAERARVALVGDRHARAARRAQLRRRDPGATETDHQHALAGEVRGTPCILTTRLADLEDRDQP